MIICVEKDDSIRELEVYTLRSLGMRTAGAKNGRELHNIIAVGAVRLIILGITPPNAEGLAILHQLNQLKDRFHIPLIIAAAQDQKFDKVKWLDLGADDYIAKPFGMMELADRVKTVLQHTENLPRQENKKSQPLQLGLVELMPQTGQVWQAGQPIHLTVKEFELLKRFMEHPGRVYSREQLLKEIWGYTDPQNTRTLDVHIRNLRKKLTTGGVTVETVRGIGYQLHKDSPS